MSKPYVDDKPYAINISIDDQTILLDIDSGSSVNVLSKDTFFKLGFTLDMIEPPQIKLYNFNSSRIVTLGTFVFEFVFKSKTYKAFSLLLMVNRIYAEDL